MSESGICINFLGKKAGNQSMERKAFIVRWKNNIYKILFLVFSVSKVMISEILLWKMTLRKDKSQIDFIWCISKNAGKNCTSIEEHWKCFQKIYCEDGCEWLMWWNVLMKFWCLIFFAGWAFQKEEHFSYTQ